jgi:hypothetical protein
MSRAYRRWIFTKSCDFSPQGTLQLGQILMNPLDPSSALQPSGPLPLSEDIIVEITSRQNISLQANDELLAQFGAWASLGYLPAGFKSDVSRQRSNEYAWHFDKLESKIMTPSLAYVQAAMRHGDVPTSLKNWSFKKRVYMVTGVRAVSGARMKQNNAASTKVEGSVEASPLGDGQGDKVGVKTVVAMSSSDSEAFESASDFVLAYRLNEVRYRSTVTHRPYTQGETSSAETGVAPQTEISIEDFEVLKISDIPFGGDAKTATRVRVAGYDEIECFVHKDEE